VRSDALNQLLPRIWLKQINAARSAGGVFRGRSRSKLSLNC